jgi:RES domain-containing protein
MIYTSEHYSTAMLEKLVHGSGRIPPNQHYIEITIPNGVSYEALNTANLPGWASASGMASKAYGDAWQSSRRSLLLIVPSVVARVDRNFLINPDHPQFAQIKTSLHQPVWWDSRFFD